MRAASRALARDWLIRLYRRNELAAGRFGMSGAPIELGRGERLWSDHTELLDRFHLDVVPSPSGVTHLLFWRR